MDINYLDQYELSLTRALMASCCQSRLLATDDLDHLWADIAPEYMADAVPNVAEYPLVSIAWAGYVGLALAHIWDKQPERLAPVAGVSIYRRLTEHRGWDAMDEYITEEVLGLAAGTPAATALEARMHALAQQALSRLRHEDIEPQTSTAFHVYARTCRAIYRAAVSLQLAADGYHYEQL